MFVLGAALTLLTAYGLGRALTRNLAVPEVARFGLGAIAGSFLALLFLLLHVGQFLPVLFLCIPLVFIAPKQRYFAPASAPVGAAAKWIVFPLLGIFGVYYLVHAMAPEIQPDAISYHLGLATEYLRLHAFPHRVGFYEVLPQGLEMLFVLAYPIGGASAAKLVHFAFLILTVPLILLVARTIFLSDSQGYVAATLYVLAPVVGLSGASAYNDAALVFYSLLTFYLLLLEWPVLAGLAAGFCYALKFTGLMVAPLAILYLLYKTRKPKRVIGCALAAAIAILPWASRAYYLTGNPFAPLLNRFFPNLYFNPVTERELSRALSSYAGFHWPTALWSWAFTGVTQGVIGPLILLAPLALLALRKPTGRLLLAAAALLSAPVLFNVGTRFLMPGLPFLALALTMVVPGRWLPALALAQGLLCFPPVILRLEEPLSWSLRGFPWRAALRIQKESDYLKSATADYNAAQFLEAKTTPQDRVFALNGISKLFTTRDVLEYWHSNRALRLTSTLQYALARPTLVRAHPEWPPVLVNGVRLRSTESALNEWTVYEARSYSPGGFLYASPQWNLRASDNLADAPSAFDGNLATFWTSRTPQRAGMYLEADFDQPELVSSIAIVIGANAPRPGFVVEGRMAATGQWRTLATDLHAQVAKPIDQRQMATHALKMAGYDVIATYATGDGLGSIGRDMVRNPARWGLKDIGNYGNFHLLRVASP